MFYIEGIFVPYFLASFNFNKISYLRKGVEFYKKQLWFFNEKTLNFPQTNYKNNALRSFSKKTEMYVIFACIFAGVAFS